MTNICVNCVGSACFTFCETLLLIVSLLEQLDIEFFVFATVTRLSPSTTAIQSGSFIYVLPQNIFHLSVDLKNIWAYAHDHC